MRFYIGRPSALGNPFIIGRDGTREEVIRKYQEWLESQIQGAGASTTAQEVALSEILAAYRRGEAVELECWCAPLSCHGDVIKALVEEAARSPLLPPARLGEIRVVNKKHSR